MSMELASLEMPEGARVTPGYGPGQFLVRFANDYGASLIHDLHGHGVELGVIRYPSDDPHEFEFVYGTSINEYDSILGGIETPAELLRYLTEIAGWEKPREEYNEGPFRFVWVSAVYIDVHWSGHDNVPPFEVINIYDYAAGKSEVTNRDEFIAACLKWMRESDISNQVDNYRAHTLDPYL